MSCHICDIIKNSKRFPVLFEDQDVIAFLAEEPAVVGHIIIAPKVHVPLLETVDERILGKLFNVANKLSIAVFEGIGAKGTNILINNGISAGQDSAHFTVQIISRKDDDGLIFDWPPRQLSEEEMSTIELKLKEGISAKPKTVAKDNDTDVENAENKDKESGETENETKTEEDNYLVRQLRRLP